MDDFDIIKVIDEMNTMRAGFTSERDFQFVMGSAIKKIYPDSNVNVVMEYRYPNSEKKERRYIDILVIKGDECIPIELKYKHSGCSINLFGRREYMLENHTCSTDIRRLYFEDIKRIEDNINSFYKDNLKFRKGYAILLTNFSRFESKQFNRGGFSLCINNTSKINYSQKINWKIHGKHPMIWYPNKNSRLNDFVYLVTTIEKSNL